MEYLKNLLHDNDIDFVAKRYIAGSLSAFMVLAAWALFIGIGPNWGIDFTGGTEIHLAFKETTNIGELRSALRDLGLSDDAVQEVGGDFANEFAIRIQDPEFGAEELRSSVETRLGEVYGADWIKESRFDAEVGARLSVRYGGDTVSPAQVEQVLEGISGVKVQAGREDNEVVISFPGLPSLIQAKIATALGDKEFEVLSVDAVGPKVGGELRRQGFISVAATLGLVLLYVAFRFDVGFAPGAIVALFHDVSITVGIFVAWGLEFNLPIIGALLTIVGYSLNDTIVIYDRIRENRDRYRRQDIKQLINTSINETLARTVATSVTTFLAISAFLVIGGPVIKNFAFAMLCGIVFGTYSTVFVASPMILVMEDVKPWLNKLVASNMDAPEDSGDDSPEPTDEESLSEAEKRRREREQKASGA